MRWAVALMAIGVTVFGLAFGQAVYVGAHLSQTGQTGAGMVSIMLAYFAYIFMTFASLSAIVLYLFSGEKAHGRLVCFQNGFSLWPYCANRCL